MTLEFNETIRRRDGTLTDLQGFCKENGGDLEPIEQEISALADDVSTNTSAIGSITSQLSALVDDVGANTSAINTIISKLDTFVEVATANVSASLHNQTVGNFPGTFEFNDIKTKKLKFAVIQKAGQSSNRIVVLNENIVDLNDLPDISSVTYTEGDKIILSSYYVDSLYWNSSDNVLEPANRKRIFFMYEPYTKKLSYSVMCQETTYFILKVFSN